MGPFDHGGDLGKFPGVTLDFSVNLNPLGMPPGVRRAVTEGVETYAAYPDPACRALRRKLAENHGLSEAQILCGNGASELIYAICAAVRGQRTGVLAPTFSEYRHAAQVFGGQVWEHRLDPADGFALTEKLLTDLTPETRLLFLCTPNNPTGMLIAPPLLEEIARICGKNGTILVVDECFLPFTEGNSLLPRLEDFPHLLVLRAFTKTYAMAGLRLGTLYGDPKRLEHIAQFCPPWHVSAVAQAAGLAALAETGWLEKTRAIVARERDFLTGALGGLGLTVFPGQGNFLLLQSTKPLWGPLREKGILTRACDNFTGLDETYLRVGVKPREDNIRLVEAVKEALHG